MSFKVLHSSEIDSLKWDNRISAQNSEMYNEYHYLNACTLNNWYGIVWGDYDAILPFYQKKKWGIIPYICMPPFCQKFDTSFLNVDMFNEVIHYFQTHFWLVDYQVSNNFENLDFKKRNNFILQKQGMSLDVLTNNYATLLKKNLGKSKLEIECSDLTSEIYSFLNTNEEFKGNVAKKYLKHFRSLCENKEINKVVYSIRLEGKIEAILMAPFYRNQAYLLFPFSSKKGKKTQSMSVMIDHLIKDKNLDIINFEGSSIDSIAKFYEQFGPSLEVYWSLNWEKWHFLRI